VYYPPTSLFLGALLAWLLPAKLVMGAYVWVVLVGAGYSMYRVAIRFMPRQWAMMAAAGYLANPYNIMSIHRRFSFNELLASALLPAVILWVYRLAEGRRWGIIGAALGIALLWLTSIPMGIVTVYAGVVLVICVLPRERFMAGLIRGAVALLVGTGLVGIYMVPIALERKWVDQTGLLRFTPFRSFLFSPRNMSFFAMNLACMAVVEILTIWLAWRLLRRRQGEGRRFWAGLTGMAVFSFLMTVPLTIPLWRVLPLTEYVQFPWRFLLPLSFVFVVLLVAAAAQTRQSHRRLAVALVVATTALGFVVPLKRYLYDPKIDIAELVERMNNGTGYLGYPEYVPPDVRRPITPAPARATASPSDASVSVEEWHTERRRLLVQSAKPAQLTVALLDNPHWAAAINGKPVSHSRTTEGLISVSVPPGRNEVELRFRENVHLLWGGMVSALGVFVLAGTIVMEKRRNPWLQEPTGAHQLRKP
jgi:hypothetical protein